MKMRSLLFAIGLCIASAAMADLVRVNVVMDISDPDNVMLTNYEENCNYGGIYFVIDGLVFSGAVPNLSNTGPGSSIIPELQIGSPRTSGDTLFMLSSGTVWMEYGRNYNMGAIALSSDPRDYYANDHGDIYLCSFIMADAFEVNGLGSTKLLGTIIPEPASVSLFAAGALVSIRRRRYS